MRGGEQAGGSVGGGRNVRGDEGAIVEEVAEECRTLGKNQ